MMTEKRSDNQRIDPLTSLRFIAATLVIAYHGKGHFVYFDEMPEQLAYTQPVCFFFLLSGFILTYVYRHMDNFVQIKDCWIKRFARIWPLHITIFLMRFFMFPKYLLTFPGTANKTLVLLANISMLHGWVPLFQFFFSYNAPSWSISTEFFFYLAFPFILPRLIKHPFLTLLGAFAINAAAIYFCNLYQFPEINEAGIELRGLLYIIPPPRLFEFVLGMALARLYLGPLQKLNLSKPMATLLELVAVALTAYLMWNTRAIAAQAASLSWIGPAGGYWFINTGVPLLGFCLTILIMGLNRGWLSSLLSLPLLVFLGEISYSVYLLHHPLLCYHGLYFSQYRSQEAFYLFLAILILMSHLMFQFVEAPMRRSIISGATKLLNKSLVRPEKPKAERKWSRQNSLYLGEAVLLAVLLYIAHPGLTTLSAAQAQASANNNLVLKTAFDQDLTLLSAVKERKGERLSLIWQAEKPFKSSQFLNIHYLDKDGKNLSTQVVRLTPGEQKIAAGTIWQEEIDLLPAYQSQTKKLGLVIYESATNIKTARLIAEGQMAMQGQGGEFSPSYKIDEDNHRLIFNW